MRCLAGDQYISIHDWALLGVVKEGHPLIPRTSPVASAIHLISLGTLNQ